jgi:hypothetical protein
MLGLINLKPVKGYNLPYGRGILLIGSFSFDGATLLEDYKCVVIILLLRSSL